MKIVTMFKQFVFILIGFLFSIYPIFIIFGFFNPTGYWENISALTVSIWWISNINQNVLKVVHSFMSIYLNKNDDITKMITFIEPLIDQKNKKE